MPQDRLCAGQGGYAGKAGRAGGVSKKNLQPKLAEAQAGQRVVLFVDAAHFVYGAFLGSWWCFARGFLRSPSGRQRFNVLGALDAVSRQVHLFTNET